MAQARDTPRDGQKELRATSWHVLEAEEVVSKLDTDAERGLSGGEARARLERYGRNRIRSKEAMPWWRVLLRQVTDPLIYILLIAVAVSLIFREYVDAVVILAVVVINGLIGFVQELRARKAIQALAEMTAAEARVVRDGEEQDIAGEEVVPGDLVVLKAGGRVPADVRIVHAQELQVDESALTAAWWCAPATPASWGASR